jgi:trehalose/maltose transport system substrate-binding protein
MNPVQGLFADSMSGSISRREIMKRAGALGLGASMLSLLVKGYGNGVLAQDGTPAAVGYSLVAPEGLRTDLSGTTITMIQGDGGSDRDWEEAAAATFTEATGIEVVVQEGPTSATDRLTQYRQLLGAESSDVDGMQIDVIWPGVLASHAVDLSEALTWQGHDFFERIVANNTVNDILVGVPWFTDAGLLYYRKDLMEANGISEPPATWDDLEAAAQTIMDAEKSNNADFQGFVWQGNPYEGLTCDALEWQVSNGGGVIIEADGTVSVNNENAIASFERARGWVNGISPEGVTTYMEEEARGVWQGGNAAFMRNWPYAYALGQADDSSIKDTFGVGVLPKGTGEGAQNADCLGGWQFMVSKYSENVDAAIEYAKFMSSFEVQKSFAIEKSHLPTISSLYEDADVLAANEFFGSLVEVFLGGAVARPSTVSADLYPDVSAAYYTAVNQILVGAVEAGPAVEELAGQLEDVMAQL